MGRGERLEQLLPAIVARPARGLARDRDAEARGQRLDGLGKIEPVHLPDEVDDITARAASEAVVETLLAVHGEGRRAFVVKRAEALPGASGLLQLRVLADDLDDVRRGAQLGHDAVGDVEVAHRSSTMVAPFPPSRASPARKLATEGCSRK